MKECSRHSRTSHGTKFVQKARVIDRTESILCSEDLILPHMYRQSSHEFSVAIPVSLGESDGNRGLRQRLACSTPASVHQGLVAGD